LFNQALAKVFGTSNERILKRLTPMVQQINVLEPEMQALTDEQLRANRQRRTAQGGERSAG